MANQYRKQGMSIFDAAVRGSVSRLRPILMTSFAFICGLIPLVMASGAGALGNRSIGTAAAGGMFIGTFVGIFLVPGLYLIFESWSAHLNRNKVSYDEEMKNNNINKTGFNNRSFLSDYGKLQSPFPYSDRKDRVTQVLYG